MDIEQQTLQTVKRILQYQLNSMEKRARFMVDTPVQVITEPQFQDLLKWLFPQHVHTIREPLNKI
jgi:hypothetical protein